MMNMTTLRLWSFLDGKHHHEFPFGAGMIGEILRKKDTIDMRSKKRKNLLHRFQFFVKLLQSLCVILNPHYDDAAVARDADNLLSCFFLRKTVREHPSHDDDCKLMIFVRHRVHIPKIDPWRIRNKVNGPNVVKSHRHEI